MNADRHDLANKAWGDIKALLVARGLINLSHMTADGIEALDIAVGAIVDTAIEQATKLERPDNDVVLCKVDAAKLNVNKPDDGHRILVDSSSFSLGDGHVKIQPGQEMVIRFHKQQVLIVIRPTEA